uniref:Retrotransposon gag domain-containing protein n=1 Tax=Salix viminalis TaxID=40686 RepID=A0A6N2NFK5_SALVM
MKIAGREKHGHLTGDIAQPAVTNSTFNKWRASDCQVKSWLFDAMQPNQIKRFIRYDTAKQVWDAIKQTYSDGADEAKIYDLHRRSFIMRQAGASVAKYYSELTEIFQELDQLNPSTMEHPSDIEIRRKEVDRLRVYIFLAVSEQPITMVEQDQELLRTSDNGTEHSDSEQPVIVVQQDQESPRTPDADTSSDNFPLQLTKCITIHPIRS